MAFPNITALTNYTNAYINTNHSDGITGAQLNIVLNGIIQFLTPVNINIYEHTVMTTPSVTASNFDIPLNFTPTSCLVQAAVDVFGASGSLTGLTVLSSVPITDGIRVYIASKLPTTQNITFSYIAS